MVPILLAGLTATGCVVEETSLRDGRRLVIPGGETYEIAERRDDLPDTPMITQTGMSNSIGLTALGSIPYDGYTLPVTSESTEEQYVAVQVGEPVPIDILLASGRGGSTGAGISIYRCSGRGEPELVRSHSGGIILGRNSNSEGVLVERSNSDGSRWIGIAPWDGDDVRWIVSNGDVNAHGWIGDDASIAYSRRAVDDQRFEIVVRGVDESAWSVGETLPYSWEYPILAPSGGGLYALRRGDGYADLAWGEATDERSFRDSLVLHRTSDRVDDLRAWETLGSTTSGSGVRRESVAWFSRELRRLVLWNPRALETKLLPAGSLAACRADGDDRWFVTKQESLQLAEILQTKTATSMILEQPWVARPSVEGSAILALAQEGRLELALLDTEGTEVIVQASETNAEGPEETQGTIQTAPGPDPDPRME